MLVDDSAVVRGFLSRWIAAEPGFSVVGGAANGQEALDLFDVLRPDIVLLDIDMPVLDGPATLARLLARRPDLAVVVVSTLTRRNAEISLGCLARGAVDILTKPESQRDLAGPAAFRGELMLKLRGLAARHRRTPGRGMPPLPGFLRRAALPATVRPRVLAIGASTGGPAALCRILRGLSPVSDRMPILLVQHMPELFTGVFAEQLRTQTGLAVAEAEEGEEIRPGRLYLAPGGRHMGLGSGEGAAVIRLRTGPPLHHCRPALDVTFADVARLFGPAALGVVLTGMGTDGTDGARALVEAGASVIVQDEATSTVWGMPGSIVKAGLARRVVPLDGIAAAIREAALP
ncbi:chemotaxis-specific protein-glutamate methyltransferase CheB [Enterovirga aerilata]|uniref:Protein-glutamate methylesterase/protein-glutamine glutaminase n=1 Tax=Enterovirga aerilata TaxID=2730920 RepID=A0A849I1I6_9HYPH|nr:chemotaxis-specific protein-glutamate methyltransferase CheB [Enterovirga sp. DB1703]NNM73646.1 chemotaxis-specific protein-glutamate methyltransferase CheB [Enterovirga sp. DB1703]